MKLAVALLISMQALTAMGLQPAAPNSPAARSVNAARSMALMKIEDLRASSNSYFFDPANVTGTTKFIVRQTMKAQAANVQGLPVYLQTPVCKVEAYKHLFTFGQTPSQQLTARTPYLLLHVRRDWEDVEEGTAHIRVSLGSYYANPRVLILDCKLKTSNTLADLNAALEGAFAIRP